MLENNKPDWDDVDCSDSADVEAMQVWDSRTWDHAELVVRLRPKHAGPRGGVRLDLTWWTARMRWGESEGLRRARALGLLPELERLLDRAPKPETIFDLVARSRTLCEGRP